MEPVSHAQTAFLDLPKALQDYFLQLGDDAFDFLGQLAPQDRFGLALAYKHLAGCSVFPTVCGDPKRAKTPAIEWSPYRERMPTDDELRAFFSGYERGIGIVCGAASGHLEILDFEISHIYEEYRRRVMEQKGELFWRRFYITKTPKGGRHVYYRCAEGVGPGQKLARRTIDGTVKPELLIETRGEGHYVLDFGSPASAHASGKKYKIEQLTPEDIPVISTDDREYLLALARSFDRFPAGTRSGEDTARPHIPRIVSGEAQGRPGDDFNLRAAWADILLPHGWSVSHERDGVTYWTRPGKDVSQGHSASTGYGGDYFYVFSSSVAEFETERGYSKFSAYSILNHGGDFSAAAKDLSAKGYGTKARSLGWDDIPDEDAEDVKQAEGSDERTVAAQRAYMLAIVEAECDLFPDQYGAAMATIREAWRTLNLKSPEFAGWLDKLYRDRTGRYPSHEAASGAVETLVRQALIRPQQAVYTRYATVVVEGRPTVFVNLMDGQNFIEISAGGVRLVPRPAARMMAGGRTSLPLPLPDLDATPNDLLALKRVINAKGENDLVLVLGYLVGCITSTGPFPILAISGEQGSAKSTTIEIIRHILDPDSIEHIEMPENILDLRAVVKAHTALCLDNVSKLSRSDSDRLCRIATGGGIVSRSLYTNDELSALKVSRPILLNSIPSVSEHGDVADRCISISLPTLADEPGKRKRKDTVVMPAFRAMLPKILGALYRAVSASLREHYECKSNVRMIEFVERVGAAEAVLPWPSGKFESLVAKNRAGSLADAAENDPIAAAVIEFVGTFAEGSPWRGTWGALLCEVRQRCSRAPDTERGLQSVVARATPLLRARGVVVERVSRNKGVTQIRAYCRPVPEVGDDAEEGDQLRTEVDVAAVQAAEVVTPEPDVDDIFDELFKSDRRTR